MKNVIIGVIAFMMMGCSVVGPGQKGVSVYMGEVQHEVKSEGWYVWVPFVRSVKTLNMRIQKTEYATEAATKDMQKVSAKIAINWHIDPVAVNKIFQSVGDEDDIVKQIIDPAVSEVLKAASAKMTAEEVLTKRIELKDNIDKSLVLRLKTYDIMVSDISLVDLNFTAEFNHAVEAKQIAEQKAKQAEYEALQATQDAKAAVNKAKASLLNARAQAEGQKLLQLSITKDVLQLEYLKKWNGKLPNVLTGNTSSVMLNIPAENEAVEEKKQKEENVE